MKSEAQPYCFSVHTSRDDPPVGAAVALGGGLFVTCAHVVNLGLGRNRLEVERPSENDEVLLRRTFLGEGSNNSQTSKVRRWVVAKVEYWSAPTNQHEGSDDLCILSCGEAAEPTKIDLAPPEAGQKIELWGYHRGGKQGAPIVAEISGIRDDGRCHCQGSNDDGVFLQPGASGAGVFDQETGSLVAIVSGRYESSEGREGLLIGSDVLGRAISIANVDDSGDVELAECFDQFFEYIEQEDSKLSQRSSRTDDRFKVLREPNFILYKVGSSYAIAIVDKDSDVKSSGLTIPQYENSIFAPQVNLFPKSNIERTGFSGGFVHPAILPTENKRLHIFVDANIFFQFLYFPYSRITLPRDARDRKTDVSISSFYRALLRLHGQQNVFPCEIAASDWKTDPLCRAVYDLPAFTRFAPTPNNSLHIGSLRNALASYILYLRQQIDGRFSVRFDDTNLTIHENEGYTNSERDILLDLNWLGIGTTGNAENEVTGAKEGNFEQKISSKDSIVVFSQSDQSQQPIYEICRKVLSDYGAIVTSPEGYAFKITKKLIPYYCWLDAEAGPKIRYNFPKEFDSDTKTTIEAEERSFEIFWKDRQLPRYRFAGAIDDMLHFSHINRDFGQTGLTEMQSALRQAIFNALSDDGIMNAQQYREDLRKQSLKYARGKSRPIPFLSPRIYFHSAIVVNERGEKYSKSEPTVATIRDARRERSLLPEAVLATLCSSFVPSNLDDRDLRARSLAIRAVRFGRVEFLNWFSKRCEASWLLANTQMTLPALGNSDEDVIEEKKILRGRVPISDKLLKKFDSWCVNNMSYWRFQSLSESGLRQVFDIGEVRAEIVEECFRVRAWFDSWKSVLRILAWLHRSSRESSAIAERLSSIIEFLELHQLANIKEKTKIKRMYYQANDHGQVDQDLYDKVHCRKNIVLFKRLREEIFDCDYGAPVEVIVHLYRVSKH